MIFRRKQKRKKEEAMRYPMIKRREIKWPQQRINQNNPKSPKMIKTKTRNEVMVPKYWRNIYKKELLNITHLNSGSSYDNAKWHKPKNGEIINTIITVIADTTTPIIVMVPPPNP